MRVLEMPAQNDFVLILFVFVFSHHLMPFQNALNDKNISSFGSANEAYTLKRHVISILKEIL